MKRATKEHYKILEIKESATLDEVKKAYRKRAFELHPDLNPNKKDASALFQALNEAYVIITGEFSAEDEQKAKASAKYQEQAKQASQEQTQASSSQSQTKQEAEKEKQKEEQKTETHKRTYSKVHVDNETKRKAQAAYFKESTKSQSRVHSPGAKPQEKETPPSQEDVLRDILNDPFARRVYEDIYSSIKNPESTKSKTKEEAKKAEAEKKVEIDWLPKGLTDLKLSDGVGGYMKSWARKQIDDSLEYRLPISSLYPGARIRLQIAQGFSKESKTVDITLPRDFVIGKPVRLVGLGKKVGKWQGDLYITLLPNLPQS